MNERTKLMLQCMTSLGRCRHGLLDSSLSRSRLAMLPLNLQKLKQTVAISEETRDMVAEHHRVFDKLKEGHDHFITATAVSASRIDALTERLENAVATSGPKSWNTARSTLMQSSNLQELSEAWPNVAYSFPLWTQEASGQSLQSLTL